MPYFDFPQMRTQNLRNELARWLKKARRGEITSEELPVIQDNLRSLTCLCHDNDILNASDLFHKVSQQLTKIIGKHKFMQRNINLSIKVSSIKPRDYLKSWRNTEY